jgi:DtxR family Mn-dependent transcriptional regulator
VADPGQALLVFFALTVAALVLLWPKRGVVPRFARLLRMSERVRLEDALKQLYNSEYEARVGTVDSVAGALEISRSEVVRLVGRLEAEELVHSGKDGIRLTDEGRAYALRILRSHRLWERYLADRTAVDPSEWHDRAERREHTLSSSETDELAARMGDPRYDPHGDPIPTAEGEIPPQSGKGLHLLHTGDAAVIVHLEDEPQTVYDQLLAEGLAPQMPLRVLESRPDAIRFDADGREHTLEPIVAANVTVTPVPASQLEQPPSLSLDQLPVGESGTVSAISPSCQGPQRRRLLDLGLVPGTVVTVEMASPLRDPMAYRIRGAVIALRRQQASWIHIHHPSAEARN